MTSIFPPETMKGIFLNMKIMIRHTFATDNNPMRERPLIAGSPDILT